MSRQNRGKLFEGHIKSSLDLENIFNYRLIDNIGAWGGNSAISFGVSNIADYIAYYLGSLFFIEAKTTRGKSLPFTNIRDSQIEGMIEAVEHEGVYGCLVVEFSDVNRKFLICIKEVSEFIETADRKSIPVSFFTSNGFELNTIKGKRVQMKLSEGLDHLIN